MQEIIKNDECIFILFLYHHNEYPYRLLHATELFTWGLEFLGCNAITFLSSFLMQM
jgi:hypothetical protein